MAEKLTIVINGEEYVSKAAKAAGDSIDNLGKKTEDSSKKSKLSITDLTASYFLLKDVIGKVADFVGELTTKFGEEEQSMIRLNAAAANNPMITGDFGNRIREYAENLMWATGIEHEEIENQAALAAGIGLTEDQIHNITQAAADWAATGAVSFDSAFQTLMRTYSGQEGMLGRMIPGLKDLTAEELKSGAAVERVGDMFAGMAVKAHNSLLGARQDLNNSFSELEATVGKALSPLEVAFDRTGTIVSKALTKAIEGGLNNADTNKWFRDFLISCIKVLADIKHFFDQAWLDIGNVFAEVWYGIKKMIADQIVSIASAIAVLQGKALSQAQKDAIASLVAGAPPERQISNVPTGENIEKVYQEWQALMKQGWTYDAAIKQIMTENISRIKDSNDGITELIGVLMMLPPSVQEAIQKGAEEGVKGIVLHGGSGNAQGIGPIGNMPTHEGENATPAQDTSFWDNLGTGILGMFGNVVQDIMAGDFVKMILDIVGSLKSLQPLFNIFARALEVIDGFLTPLINALAPLLNFILFLANMIGKVLTPILTAFAPIIQILMAGLILFYNLAIMPLGNAIIFVAKLFQSIVASVYNTIADVVNFLLGWLGVHMDKMDMPDWKTGWLTPIEGGQFEPGNQTGGTTIYGGNTSIQKPPDIYLYQYYNAPIIGAGGMSEVGQFTVQAIQAYYGSGGRVQLVEATT
jgi:hypothetical protein